MLSGLYARLLFTISLTLALAQTCLPAEGFVLSTLQNDDVNRTIQKLESTGCIIKNLSGVWNYKIGEQEPFQGWIPSAFTESDHAVDFVRSITLDDSLESYDWELFIPSYRYRLDVSVNGNLLLAGRGDFASLRVPIRPEYFIYGSQNEISLSVQNDLNRSTSVPLQPGLFQPAGYAGILSDVYLIGRQRWSFAGVALHYNNYTDSADFRLLIDLRANPQVMRNRISPADTLYASIEAADIVLCAELRDSVQSMVTNCSMNLSDYYLSSHSHPLKFPAFSPVLWSPERPYQYDLNLFIVYGKDTLSQWSEKAAFSHIDLSIDGFNFGDSTFKLKAVDYILQDPNGLPVSTSTIESDIGQIKRLGFNTVRVRGSLPSEIFMAAADSIGLWVISDLGLTSVPAELITADFLSNIRSGPMMQVIRYSRSHPSLLAICTGSLLEYQDSRVDSIVNLLTTETQAQSERLCFIESTGKVPANIRADFLMIARAPYQTALPKIPNDISVPVVYSNLGWLSQRPSEADSLGRSKQGSVLRYQISKAKEADNSIGFVVHCFADYLGASPLIVRSDYSHPNNYSYGLLTSNRRNKPAADEIGIALEEGGVTGINSEPIPASKYPIIFPAFALIAILILSISIRGNNVFRQNLSRVFRHSHGFFSDIRHRRYLPTSHTLLLWLLNSASITGILVSIAYWLRDSVRFDYFLTFIGLAPGLKAFIGQMLWSPGQAASIVFCFVLLIELFHILYLKLISNLFRPRVSLGQLWKYANWSFTPFLYLLPFCAVLYRLLEFHSLMLPSLVLCGLGFLWSLFRLISALQNGFQTTFFRVTLLFILLTGVLLSGCYFAADHWLNFSAYWRWMLHQYPIS